MLENVVPGERSGAYGNGAKFLSSTRTAFNCVAPPVEPCCLALSPLQAALNGVQILNHEVPLPSLELFLLVHLRQCPSARPSLTAEGRSPPFLFLRLDLLTKECVELALDKCPSLSLFSFHTSLIIRAVLNFIAAKFKFVEENPPLTFYIVKEA